MRDGEGEEKVGTKDTGGQEEGRFGLGCAEVGWEDGEEDGDLGKPPCASCSVFLG